MKWDKYYLFCHPESYTVYFKKLYFQNMYFDHFKDNWNKITQLYVTCKKIFRPCDLDYYYYKLNTWSRFNGNVSHIYKLGIVPGASIEHYLIMSAHKFDMAFSSWFHTARPRKLVCREKFFPTALSMPKSVTRPLPYQALRSSEVITKEPDSKREKTVKTEKKPCLWRCNLHAY